MTWFAHIIKLFLVVLAVIATAAYFHLVMGSTPAYIAALLVGVGTAAELWASRGGRNLVAIAGSMLPVVAWPGLGWLLHHLLPGWTMETAAGAALIPVALVAYGSVALAGDKGSTDLVRAWVSLQIGAMAIYSLLRGVAAQDPSAVFTSALGALLCALVITQSELIPPATRGKLVDLLLAGAGGAIAVGVVAVLHVL